MVIYIHNVNRNMYSFRVSGTVHGWSHLVSSSHYDHKVASAHGKVHLQEYSHSVEMLPPPGTEQLSALQAVFYSTSSTSSSSGRALKVEVSVRVSSPQGQRLNSFPHMRAVISRERTRPTPFSPARAPLVLSVCLQARNPTSPRPLSKIGLIDLTC